MNRKGRGRSVSGKEQRVDRVGRVTFTDQLFYSTVRLTAFKDEEVIGYGTGFFWQTILDDGGQVTTIISNKHVMADADCIIASLHLATEAGGPSGKTMDFGITLKEFVPVSHPDPEIDLMTISMGAVNQICHKDGTPLFFIPLNANLIPSEAEWKNLDFIEEVIMLGCPNGIFDEVNNLPIARRGITASPLPTYSYNGRSEFLVDMACFEGSSGSPIFTMRSGHFGRRPGAHKRPEGFYFVGILYAGPTITGEGEIVLNKSRINFESMMHLGVAIRSPAMLEIDQLIRQREKVDALLWNVNDWTAANQRPSA